MTPKVPLLQGFEKKLSLSCPDNGIVGGILPRNAIATGLRSFHIFQTRIPNVLGTRCGICVSRFFGVCDVKLGKTNAPDAGGGNSTPKSAASTSPHQQADVRPSRSTAIRAELNSPQHTTNQKPSLRRLEGGSYPNLWCSRLNSPHHSPQTQSPTCAHRHPASAPAATS